MNISTVYINTYRKDFDCAKTCIASIRYWYPDLPIVLIKDMGAGPFDTSDVEKGFGVRVLDTQGRSFGWGFGKFEPLFAQSKESFLFMDADTVMVGPVLDLVKDLEADFVVDDEPIPWEKVVSLYYDPEKVASLKPAFVYPGFMFNTGQWFGTSGLLSREDFNEWVGWNPLPYLKYPEIFRQADQGIFNFILHCKFSEGAIRLQKVNLMLWPSEGKADHVSLDKIRQKVDALPRIIHWAGMKKQQWREMPRQDILNFFDAQYYVRMGVLRKFRDRARQGGSSITGFFSRISTKAEKLLQNRKS